MRRHEKGAPSGRGRIGALSALLLLTGGSTAIAGAPAVEGAFGRVVIPWEGRAHVESGALFAADRTATPTPLRGPEAGSSCGPLVSDPGTFCLDMGRQFGNRTNADIRFPNYQAVADQIAQAPDPAKRARAEEYLKQARTAWEAGFHETALDLLRNAQVALY